MIYLIEFCLYLWRMSWNILEILAPYSGILIKLICLILMIRAIRMRRFIDFSLTVFEKLSYIKWDYFLSFCHFNYIYAKWILIRKNEHVIHLKTINKNEFLIWKNSLCVQQRSVLIPKHLTFWCRSNSPSWSFDSLSLSMTWIILSLKIRLSWFERWKKVARSNLRNFLSNQK